ncbi:MAG TPA: DUF1049 domain-containing protein [Desulfosporosinus sp.]|nr:DUF1049 domain-containing protein [Desulfosporosinus sp.]
MFVLILSLICSLLIALFAVQNASLVTIHLFWITKEVPLVLVILGSTFAGAFIMLLLAIWRGLRQKLKPKQEAKDESLINDQSIQSAKLAPPPSDNED